ncbi:MAG: hypothetical protein AABX73_00200 [Nanoarchaeota archaeon]
MGINRDEAKNWSKDRIKEELTDLRRQVNDFYEDIRSAQQKMEDLERDAEESRERGDYYHTNEKQLDGLSSYIDKYSSITTELESDIDFLKFVL